MAWGMMIIVIGSLLGSLFVFRVASVALELFSPGRSSLGAIDYLIHEFASGVWGAALIWTGVGCCRVRRWVAPLVFAESATLALLNVSLLARFLNMMMYPSSFYFSPQIPIELLLCFGLPAAACVYFSRRNVRGALTTNDPHWDPSRSGEDYLHAWSAGCLLFGLTNAMTGISILRYTMPLVSLFLWLNIVLVAAGVICYRKINIGWVGTVLILGVLLIIHAVAFADSLGLHTGILPSSTNFTPGIRRAGTPIAVHVGLAQLSGSWWISRAIGLLRLLMYVGALCVGVYVGRVVWPVSSHHPPTLLSEDVE
jgi:hypothetical protein